MLMTPFLRTNERGLKAASSSSREDGLGWVNNLS